MKTMKSFLLVAFLVLFTSLDIAFGQGNGNGNGNQGGFPYRDLEPVKGTGQERCECFARGSCFNKVLTCPKECPERRPKNMKDKACFADCSSKCETSCRTRKPSCEGFGAVCYDPRFIGGDGRVFYFHGSKGGDYALFTDDDLQVNAHFIGTRPEGRTRDFTWVQALSVIFNTHNLIVGAKRVAQWDDSVDVLTIRWNGQAIEVPLDGEAEWRTSTDEGKEVIIERTDKTNSVKVIISGLLEVNVQVTPIGAEENRVHNYQLPSDDAFAHLETEFKFVKLTDMAEGVLGKTYRPDYVSPVKTGVAMPMMGGEDKYRTPSLLSTVCNSCRFKGLQYAITSALATVM